MTARIDALIPDLEAYIASGMKAFDAPGLAIGIVTGDRLVYAKGFGVRGKSGGGPVDTRTVFQIGSTTKAFLATTMAIGVDHGNFKWDDRVVDLHPDFQLEDPWVTREFRMFDLMAQRSGLPGYANDVLMALGYDEPALIRSLRNVEPVSSFRTTFAYTNVTHLLAGRIVAERAGLADWNTVVRREILDPLGMTETTDSADAIEAAADHARGHRYTPDGSIEVPFTQLSPYAAGAAGAINSSVEDMAKWLRLQLGNGTFEGRRIVSPENLAVIRTPKVAISDKVSYAMGWVIIQTPNGGIVAHNGGTAGFGAYVGLLVDKDVGVVVLTNQQNMGFPDAVGAWTLDRLLGNPPHDDVAETLKKVKAKVADDTKTYAKPADARPFPPLAPLAGNLTNPSFGKAALRPDGDALMLALQATGAELRLEPWNGDIFTIRIVPGGKFAAMAENLGDVPLGFAQFQMDPTGKLGTLRLSMGGQAFDFSRDPGGKAGERKAVAPAATPGSGDGGDSRRRASSSPATAATTFIRISRNWRPKPSGRSSRRFATRTRGMT
ncbi:MAG: serine hydrolase [Acetobacteraceae bacterium]